VSLRIDLIVESIGGRSCKWRSVVNEGSEGSEGRLVMNFMKVY
jgi:hypothetical protein